MHRSLFPSSLGLALVAAVTVASLAGEAAAASVIKRPGAHPDYVVELEPHGNLAYGYNYFGDVGIGVGFRATIPFLDNGPISKINNNMGISFGLDWHHFEDECGRWRGFYVRGEDCTSNQFWFPIALQWNFFLTDIISVFGEPGLAPVYHNEDYAGLYCGNFIGDCDEGDGLTVRPVFWGGARFMFGETVGLTVRIGYPSITVGASFLL